MAKRLKSYEAKKKLQLRPLGDFPSCGGERRPRDEVDKNIHSIRFKIENCFIEFFWKQFLFLFAFKVVLFLANKKL